MRDNTADTAVDHELLALSTQLCFALYSASRSMTAAYRPFLDSMSLTYPQYLVLLTLWERPGITMKELGDHLHLDYGTVSPIVARLRDAAMVESVRSARDGRAVALRATDESLALRPHAESMIRTVIDGVGYPLAELGALRDDVKALAERLDAFAIRAGARS